MLKDKKTQESLEKIIKKTFCNLDTVMDCAYAKREWCPKTCGYYQRETKHWIYDEK